MESGIKTIENALEVMKSIQSLDDMKEHKEEILTMIENTFKFLVDSLKEIIKKSLSPDEIQKEMEKIQEKQIMNEQLGEKMEQELNRIANLPGAEEFIVGLKEEMESRLEPHAEELAVLMGELMTAMMGEVLGGLGELMQDTGDEDES